MTIRSFTVEDRLGQQSVTTSPFPHKRLWMLSLGAGITFSFTVLTLLIVTAARIEAPIQLPDLPETYLPGKVLPDEVSCYTYSNEYIPRCSVSLEVYEVYFEFDADSKEITRAAIPARNYTLGQMLIRWGTPVGIEWNDSTIRLYWGRRAALLYTHSLRPDSRVEFILYDLEQHAGSPWRGFRLDKY